MAKREKIMSSKEWGAMKDVLSDASDCFFESAGGRSLFSFLLRLTVGWGGFETTSLTQKSVEDGLFNGKRFSVGPGLRRSAFFDARKELMDQGVMQIDGNVSRFNVPGMLSALSQSALGRSQFWTKDLQEAHRTTTEEFRRRGWPCEVAIMTDNARIKIEDGLKAAVDQSADARGRKQAKVLNMRRDALSPNQLLTLMQEFCTKHGEMWSESEAPGKLGGNLKTFLKLCSREDRDPRVHLEDVVRFWHIFRSEEVKTEAGKPLLLFTTVSFSQYFKWRKEIDAYIAEEREYLEGRLKPSTLYEIREIEL